MTDLATLGIAIDSTPMARARDELGRFVGAAKAAQQAASGLEGQAAAAGEEMASAGAAASAAAGQLTKAGQAAGQAGVGFQGAGAGAEKIIPPLTKLPPLARQSSMQLQQLTYQLNDVVTMGLSGASAFQILATQGGQFFQVMQMGEGGFRGTASRILAGLMALPGPAKVAGAAVAALGVAWAVYESVGRDKVKSLDEVLVDHAALVRDIKKAYGEAATGLDGYTSRGFGEFQARGRASISELQIQSRSLSNDLFGELGSLVTPARTGQTYYRVADRFGEFSDAILKLREEARAGRPDVEAFIKTIADTAQADPFNESLQKSATEAIRLADSLRGVVGQKAALEQFFDSSGNMAAALSGELDKVVKSLDDLARVSETLPEQAERLYRSGLLTAQGPGARAALEAAYLAAQDRIAGAKMPLPRAKPNLAEFDPNAFGTEAVKSAGDQLKALISEVDALGMGKGQLSAYRMEQERLNAAAKAGIELSPGQIEAIRATAKAYGDLVSHMEARTLRSNLLFDRDQQGRSVVERQVASSLRAIYGDTGYLGHMQDFEAQQIRNNAALKAMGEAARSVRDDLEQTAEKLASIGMPANVAARRRAGLLADQQSRAAGIAGTPQAEQIRNAAMAQAEYNTVADRTLAAWEAIKGTGESAIDSLVDKISSGTVSLNDFLDVAKDIEKQFLQLAISNPLKNALFGENLPTLADAKGVLGQVFGGKKNPITDAAASIASQAVGTMAVTAAVVNINSGLGIGANDNIVGAAARSMGIGSDAVAGGKITGLNDNFRSNLNQMISDAASAGFDIDINSGYRSVERQQQLWNAALKKYGTPAAARRWVAPPGRSMHNFGMAADLGYNTPGAADWAHENAGKYGLKFPLSNENWHIEPMNARAEAAGRSLQDMANSAKSAAQATSGLGSGLNDLTNSVSSAASKIGQGGGGISLGGINYGALGAPAAGGVYANGAAFFGGNVIPFANGGAFSNSIVARPTLFPMASGAGLMGEAGPEAVMPLRKASNGRLGVEVVQAVKPAMPSGSGEVRVVSMPTPAPIINNNHSGANVSYREEVMPNGQRQPIYEIDEAVDAAISKRGGKSNRTLRAGGVQAPLRKMG